MQNLTSLNHRALLLIDSRLTAASSNLRLAEETLESSSSELELRSFSIDRVASYLCTVDKALDASLVSTDEELRSVKDFCGSPRKKLEETSINSLLLEVKEIREKVDNSLLKIQSAGTSRDGIPGQRYIDHKFSGIKCRLSDSFTHYRAILEDIAYLHSFGESGVTPAILKEGFIVRGHSPERCNQQRPLGFNIDVALYDLERLDLVRRTDETRDLPYEMGEYVLTPLGRAILPESR